MDKLKVCELFAGVGGFTVGLQAADKDFFQTIWSNQFEPGAKKQYASETYVKNFGEDGHVNKDINLVPTNQIPYCDIMTGGFPCFPAGTLVLTSNGYCEIENVKDNDMLLTKDGNWKKIRRKMESVHTDIVNIKTVDNSEYLTTTPEHPFWCIKKGESEPRWVFAQYLEDGDEIGYRDFPDASGVNINTKSLWYLDGLYFIGGYVENDKVYIKVPVAVNDIKETLGAWSLTGDIEKCDEHYNTIIIDSAAYAQNLTKLYGGNLDGKALPVKVLTMPDELKESFIKGAVCANRWGNIFGFSTKKSAHSFASLVRSLHNVLPTIKLDKATNQYTVDFASSTIPIHYAYSHIWVRIEKVVSKKETAHTYNFSVLDDESYTVYGLSVHNCQDYSVARTKNSAKGLEGHKGVLWWQIIRILSEMGVNSPNILMLENVDRILLSPSSQKGRDFAIILQSLSDLGYTVEWRNINAADYGMPQRRRRVFIVAYKNGSTIQKTIGDPFDWVLHNGVMAKAFPSILNIDTELFDRDIKENADDTLVEISDKFNETNAVKMFYNAGIMMNGHYWTCKVSPDYNGPFMTLRDIVLTNPKLREKNITEDLYLSEEDIPKWQSQKGGKKINRINKASGTSYVYSEGAMSFPDSLDKPSRTIITSEMSKHPNRFTHVIEDPVDGRLRTLAPIELERLDMFPDDFTSEQAPRTRAFFMGNALVCGIVTKIGKEIKNRLSMDTTNAEERKYKDLYIQTLADYQNYRKRCEKDRIASEFATKKDLLSKILPLYHDAKRGASYDERGAVLIYQKFKNFIKDNDITILNDDYANMNNGRFSEDWAEVIGTTPITGNHSANDVAKIVEDGFLDNKTNMIISYAKVLVYA